MIQAAEIPQSTPEDFLLMDVVGGGCTSQSISQNEGMADLSQQSISAHHPSRPIVAYTSGCMIIIYDLLTDQKVNLMGHKHNVYALQFTPNGEQLMSIDFNRDAELYNSNLMTHDGELPELPSCIFLWNWKKGECIQTKYIPRDSSINEALILNQAVSIQNLNNERKNVFSILNLRSTLGCYIQICFDKQQSSTFLILQSSQHEVGGGYRVTLWNFNKQNVIEMISSMDLELQNPGIDISFLPQSQSDILNAQKIALQQNNTAQIFLNSKIPFMTAEKQCIKIWEYSQGNAKLKKRIHIKQHIVQVIISELTNFLLILGENGKLLILDQQGEFISTVYKEGVIFTKICIANDKILLGTNRGTIYVYHLASLQFISEIPYQLSFLESFSLNTFNKNQSDFDQLSLQKIGPPVIEIGITQNLRFLWIRYTDGSFVLIDRTIASPRQAILGYSCGHFENISGMQWIPTKSPFDVIQKTGDFYNLNNQNGIDKLNNQQLQEQQFITCSHDLSIHIWRHYGDRWAFSFIDLAKCFDQSLSFQRKQCDRSTKEMKLTAVSIYPKSNNLVVGDNKGIIRVFQLVNQKSHLIQTHKLVKSKQAQDELIYGLNQDTLYQNDDFIKDIYITQNESVAVVTFGKGSIIFYDIKNGFQYIGDASDQAKASLQLQDFNLIQVHTRFIENVDNKNLKLNILDKIQLYQQNTVQQQDEHPYQTQQNKFQGLKQNNKYSISSTHETSLKILSIQSPNSITLQMIEIQGLKMQRQKLCQYVISDGRIEEFDVHPSKDYILVTSNKGRIYIFRIDTGELRGTIKIPMNSSGCLIDPSGLYVLIKVPAYTSQNTKNLISDENQIALNNRIGLFASNLKSFERNTVLMFEVGTGQPAAEISSIFEIGQMKFSNDGRYLSLGSTNGSVCVWSMGNHLYKNVSEIIQAMKLQNDFWFNYPIFLPDYEQFNKIHTQYIPPPQQDLAIPNIIIKPQNFTINQQQQQNQDDDEIQDFNQRENFIQQQQLQQNLQNYQREQRQIQQQVPVFKQHQNFLIDERTPQKQVFPQQYYQQWQNNFQQIQNQPQSLQSNQQRFLRTQYTEQIPKQNIDQIQTNVFQEAVKSQRVMNSSLYQGVTLPPQYPPYQSQIQLQQSNQFNQQPFNQNFNQEQNFQNQQINYLNNNLRVNEQANLLGYQNQPLQQNNNQQFLTTYSNGIVPPRRYSLQYQNIPQLQQYQNISNNPYDSHQLAQNQNQQLIQGNYNLQGLQFYSQRYQQPQTPLTSQNRQYLSEQEKAVQILLKHKSPIQQYQNQNIDLKEPLPLNQAQLLYDQPVQLNENTLKKKFERYADFQEINQEIKNEYLSTPQQQYMRTFINDKNQGYKTQYDMSLNDRDLLIQQTQPPKALESLSKKQQNLLQSDQNLARSQTPVIQTQQMQFDKKIEYELGKSIGFSNSQTQNDILKNQKYVFNQNNQMMQQDPEDIDKDQDQLEYIDNQQNKSTIEKQPKITSNYMAGVRVPQAILNKDDQMKKATQIPSAQNILSDSDNSKQKAPSNYDIIDEVYQEIDDFEFRMSGNLKQKSKFQ